MLESISESMRHRTDLKKIANLFRVNDIVLIIFMRNFY